MRRRDGSWALAAGRSRSWRWSFVFSSFVVGPAVSAGDGASATPTTSVPSAPPPVSASAHEAHHR
jgi:hypothetical protein